MDIKEYKYSREYNQEIKSNAFLNLWGSFPETDIYFA